MQKFLVQRYNPAHYVKIVLIRNLVVVVIVDEKVREGMYMYINVINQCIQKRDNSFLHISTYL
jgi:hypothetical protein